MVAPAALTLSALARNGWVVGGLLLLAVGVGDLSVARAKLGQYRQMLEATAMVPARDPAILFPKPTEEQEQRAVALAKIGFYQQLFTAGQLLTFVGLLAIVVGVVQLRPHRVLPLPDTPESR